MYQKYSQVRIHPTKKTRRDEYSCKFVRIIVRTQQYLTHMYVCVQKRKPDQQRSLLILSQSFLSHIRFSCTHTNVCVVSINMPKSWGMGIPLRHYYGFPFQLLYYIMGQLEIYTLCGRLIICIV